MELTVSTRIDKQTTAESKSLSYHHLRSHKSVNNVRDSSKFNTYFYMENGAVRSDKIKSSDLDRNQNFHKFMNYKIDNLSANIDNDYKKYKGKKLPKNAKKMLDIIITFGSKRVKEDKDGLNETEIKAIESKNEIEMDMAALDYIKSLEFEYGVKMVYMSKHTDEKVIHYHVSISQYDFKNHQMLMSGFKKQDLRGLGENLQDMVYDSYKHLGFKRGIKGSKDSHLTIKQMHQAEIISDEKKIQKLKDEISGTIIEVKEFKDRKKDDFIDRIKIINKINKNYNYINKDDLGGPK